MGTRASRQQVKVDHFLFGKVTVKNQFNKELITCHKPMLRTDEFNYWEQKYNVAVTMNKQSLLLPQSYQKQKIQKFFMCCQCPADTEMALTYEKFDYTLQKQILVRAQNKKFYQQPELFFIMYKLLEGAKQFQLRKLRIGDIRSCKIVKTKNNDLKMINVASYPQQYPGLQMIMDYLDNKNVYYLSPEEIQFVKSRGYGSQKLPNSKTEAFSVGMTILQCATLVLSKDLYSMPSRELSVQQLQFRLKSVQEKYQKLHKYLIKILQTDKEKRLTCGQLWACLKPYSQKILDIKPFSPKQSSQKEQMQQFKNKLGKRSYN